MLSADLSKPQVLIQWNKNWNNNFVSSANRSAVKTPVTEIVYYAPREEKLGQSVWIDTRAEGEGVKHKLWVGQFYSCGAYTIFPHIEAENAIFPFRSRAGMRHFRPGVRKISFHALYKKRRATVFPENYVEKYCLNN